MGLNEAVELSIDYSLLELVEDLATVCHAIVHNGDHVEGVVCWILIASDNFNLNGLIE